MFEAVRAVVVAGVLFLCTLPMIRAASRLDDPRIDKTMRTGLILKLLTAPAYIWVISTFYDDIADFNTYHRAAGALADSLRHGDWILNAPGGSGSRFVSGVAGVVYFLVGTSKVSGFIVFAWLAFLGQLCFYLAFRTAFPRGDRLRYARLVFLFPSVVFWTSAIGKDAWMCLTIGVAALGAARAVEQRRGGLPLLAVGVTTASLVRPHVALLFTGALGIAYLARRAPRPSAITPIAKGVGIVGMVVASVALMGALERFTGVEDLTVSSASEVLDNNEKLTTGDLPGKGDGTYQFGSNYDSTNLRAPYMYPVAALTVLFRPFPFEARNVPSFVAAIESFALLALAFRGRKRLFRVVRSVPRNGYATLVVLYTLGFIYIFSSFGNFGLLARQRVQLLPLFLMLLAATSDRERPVPRADRQLPEARSLWAWPTPPRR